MRDSSFGSLSQVSEGRVGVYKPVPMLAGTMGDEEFHAFKTGESLGYGDIPSSGFQGRKQTSYGNMGMIQKSGGEDGGVGTGGLGRRRKRS